MFFEPEFWVAVAFVILMGVPPVAPPIAMLPNSAASHPAPTTAPTPGRASMVTRLAAVAAVAPIAPPTAALSNLPLVAVSRLAPCFRSGTTLQAFPGRHQVSELFEMRLVSGGAMPAASSPMTTRFASAYES